MSRHQIGTSRSEAVVTSDEISVPLNQGGFRRDCSRIFIAAVMGVTMTLGFCSFPALFLYMWIADPAGRNTTLAVVCGILTLMLLFVISAATWPTMQTARLLKRTLRKRLPALIINREGIQDYSSNSVFGLIPWSQIQPVFWTAHHSNRQNREYSGLVIVVRDKQALRRRLGIGGYRLEDYPPSPDRREVFIPQDRIVASVEEVVEQINHFRARMNV